ncbi:MAG: Replication protein P [Cycloclasticus sp.]|nr:MAG: Replication protein P [Cycloclasticus sp.]
MLKHINSMDVGKGLGLDDHEIDKKTVTKNTVKIVNTLFAELRRTFPAWRQSLKTLGELKEAKRAWTLSFLENGINSTAQLNRGLKHARTLNSAFLPSVGQFVSWCTPTPEEFGLPDVDTAYKEAACAGSTHNWSHAAVFLAANATGRFELRRAPERLTFARFKKNYEAFCLQVTRGEKLFVALPKSPRKTRFANCGEPVKKEDVSAFLNRVSRSLR